MMETAKNGEININLEFCILVKLGSLYVCGSCRQQRGNQEKRNRNPL